MIEYWGYRARKRHGRCYELSTKALLSDKTPTGAVLVYGLWSDFQVPHAWLELPDGTVWEPISATLGGGDEQRSQYRLNEFAVGKSRWVAAEASAALLDREMYMDYSDCQQLWWEASKAPRAEEVKA